MLENQLRYQLLEHKASPDASSQFGLPEPTIACLDGKEYLVMTILNGDSMLPSVCFFQIGVESNAGQMTVSSEPTFEIEGAEIFLAA